jgi:methoxymalonate biosynthesis acyl carrier protein
MKTRDQLRQFIFQLAKDHGHMDAVNDDDPLILSGLLDSLAVVHIVVFMEEQFGIDFSNIYFDQDDFDNIDRMVSFVEANLS